MPTLSSSSWDAIIIGGGPAGSTVATTLAKAGRRVLVLEKERFPRFHIGESLLPYNRRIFDELGVWPKIAAAGFTRKRGAQFWLGDGSRHTRLNFSKGHFTEYPEAVQVERSKFDHILLEHAREAGATVVEQARVQEYEVRADAVRVQFQQEDGEPQEVTGAFLVDASGLSNFTGNREKLREYYEGHKKLAIFGHYEGVQMPDGEETGDILVVRRPRSWFWMIPLAPDKVSVGLVLDRHDFQALNQEPQAVFDEAVRTTPVLAQRMASARALNQGHVLTDFSYRNRQFVSPRLVRAGDAAGFIDPVFSSGVLLAMTSGQQAAHIIDEALSQKRVMTAGMRRYERDCRARIAEYWQFIEGFYQVPFTQLLLQPNNRLRLVCALNAVLAGRTELSWALRWRLRVFFLLAWLQKHVPLAQRIEID